MSATTATKLQIVNGALTHVGAPILADLTGTDKNTRLINQFYDVTRQKLLESFFWNFSKRRVRLTPTNSPGSVTVVGVSQASAAVVGTAVNHNFNNGDTIVLTGVVGMTQINGLKSTISSAVGTSFVMDEINSSAFSAYSSGGLAAYAPQHEWNYYFSLPSDFLKIEQIDYPDPDVYEVENNRIATDADYVDMAYIADISTESVYSATFAEALALLLGWKISYAITQDAGVRDRLFEEFNRFVRKARVVDAMQDNRHLVWVTEDWLEARGNNKSRFPRDPLT